MYLPITEKGIFTRQYTATDGSIINSCWFVCESHWQLMEVDDRPTRGREDCIVSHRQYQAASLVVRTRERQAPIIPDRYQYSSNDHDQEGP